MSRQEDTKALRHEGTKGGTRPFPFVPASLRASVPLRLLGPISLLGCIAIGGCADSSNRPPTTQQLSARQRQDQALQDPFGYGPKNNDLSDVPSVTGGSTSEFDKKGFKRDLDHVFNP